MATITLENARPTLLPVRKIRRAAACVLAVAVLAAGAEAQQKKRVAPGTQKAPPREDS